MKARIIMLSLSGAILLLPSPRRHPAVALTVTVSAHPHESTRNAQRAFFANDPALKVQGTRPTPIPAGPDTSETRAKEA